MLAGALLSRRHLNQLKTERQDKAGGFGALRPPATNPRFMGRTQASGLFLLQAHVSARSWLSTSWERNHFPPSAISSEEVAPGGL